MKKTLSIMACTLLAMTNLQAHSDRELGPNGGRMVEFSKNQGLQGEVTLTNGFFHLAVLDRNMKPMALKEHVLTVTGGNRKNPEKPKVEKQEGRFVFPEMKGDSYLVVLQLREKASAKPMTARFEYDSSICGSCKRGEWLCDCGVKKKTPEATGADKK